eukprot:scaffold63_cov306-Pinguiococcus_pyrenoidosus.AAC.28
MWKRRSAPTSKAEECGLWGSNSKLSPLTRREPTGSASRAVRRTMRGESDACAARRRSHRTLTPRTWS